MAKKKHGQRGDNTNLTVRTYQPDLATLDVEKRTVNAVLATEQAVTVLDVARMEIVDEILLMSGAEFPDQVPLMDSHDRSSISKIAGSTRSIHIEGDKLVGTHHLHNSGIGAESVGLMRAGHLTDNSAGYQLIDYKTIARGKTGTVGGQTYTASNHRPLRVTTKWRLVENSLTPIGADSAAKMRSKLQETKKMAKTKKQKEFDAFVQARGLEPDELTDEQREVLQGDLDLARAAEKAESKRDQIDRTAEGIAAEKRIAEAAVEAERARVKAIEDLAGPDVPAEVVKRCIDERKSIEETQGIMLAAVRNNRPVIGSPAITSGQEITRQDLEAALLLREGHSDDLVVKEYGEQRANNAGEMRDISLVDLCVRSLQIDRVEIPRSRQDMIRAAFSTMTLPQILGAVANKSALRGYKAMASTWRAWCNIGSIPDFKTQTRVRLTDVGELEEINNAGEIKHGSASEEYEQYNITTYGKLFAVTRKNIIDDDLGAFTRTPERMGQKAAHQVSKLVYTHLLANGAMQDGTALFHADHNNLNTSCALAKAGLATALQSFKQQTDLDGETIDIVPRYMLVPPELEVTARELLQSVLLIGQGDDAAPVPAANVLQGSLEPIVEPRLSNSNYTGYSTTTWYVTASPNDADTVEVGFLNGQDAPNIERFNADPGVLGVVYRVYIDAGVKALDFRGMGKQTA